MDAGRLSQDSRRVPLHPILALEHLLSRRAARRGDTLGALDSMPSLDGWVDPSRSVSERANRIRARNVELMGTSEGTADE